MEELLFLASSCLGEAGLMFTLDRFSGFGTKHKFLPVDYCEMVSGIKDK